MKDLKGLFCIPSGGKTGVTNKSQSYFASNLMGNVPKSPVPEKNPPWLPSQPLFGIESL